MKTSLLGLIVSLAFTGHCLAQTGDADVGIFGSGVELTGTGAGALNSGTTTLYALNQGDNGVLLPAGSTATLSTAWANGTAASPVLSLGTFLPTDSLVLKGGSLLTYSNSGATATDGMLNYQIQDSVTSYFSGFTAVGLPFNATGATVDGTGNDRFSLESGTTNLLAGLAPGTYTINIYNSSDFTDPTPSAAGLPTSGTNYDSNGGNDFGATFTVVPEPSTWKAMFIGIALLGAVTFARRTRMA